MRRAVLLLVLLLELLGCDSTDAAGACGQPAWIAPGDALAIPIHATGAVMWESGDPAITIAGTLATAEGDTQLRFDTEAGELVVDVGLPRARLGVLPLGVPVEVTLGDGLVIVEDGRIATAVISRRGTGDVVAANVTFRQVHAECLATGCAAPPCEGSCVQVMAAPLVDVVTGASTVRLEPGGLWRIGDEDAPSAEIEIVRTVRPPTPDELETVSGTPCAGSPAAELAAIVRHLR